MKKFIIAAILSAMFCMNLTACSQSETVTESLSADAVTVTSSDEPTQVTATYYADSEAYLSTISTYDEGLLTELEYAYSEEYDESYSFVTVYTYDENGYIIEYTKTSGSGTELTASYTNTYDDDGNLVGIQQSTTYTYEFGYDDEGHLITIDVDWHTMDLEVGLTLTYEGDDATTIDITVDGDEETQIILTYNDDGQVASYEAAGMSLSDTAELYTQVLLVDLLSYTHIWDDDLLANTFFADISYYGYDYSAEISYDSAGNPETEDVDENGETYTLTYANEYDSSGHLTQTTATFDDDETQYMIISYVY